MTNDEDGRAAVVAPSSRLPGITHTHRKLTHFVVSLMLIYSFGYGIARWRKFVVMSEYCIKEDGLVVRHTAPGFDVRDDWRGQLKNRVNPVAFFCFRPLCAIEDLVRGGRRTIF